MSITLEKKQELITKFAICENDSGSPEVQVALLTHRINSLGEHMEVHSKDYHSRRGLLAMVSRRRKLLDYLKTKSLERYTRLIAALGLRR